MSNGWAFVGMTNRHCSAFLHYKINDPVKYLNVQKSESTGIRPS